MRRVDALLNHIIRDLGIKDDVKLAEMKRLWSKLFREPLLSHIIPSSLTRDELLLTVDSPAWLQELKFCKQEILGKLTPFGVRSIRFRLGKVPTNKSREALRPSKPKNLTETERAFIADMVAEVGDEDLKTTVSTTISKAIASGKTKIKDER